jgi:hypothetical protein
VTAPRYRLLGLLRWGGMGLLYKGWDTKLDRPVAIKMMANRFDADAQRRAVLEAKAATRVRSDHIVQVYDAGRADDSGSPYLVMELLEGRDLEAVLQGGPVPVETAVDWILQACEALAHLKLHGLVHRDIKPANLFLETRIDGSQRLKLIDFGIVKQLTGTAFTGAGDVIGSFPYMAPEQISDSRDVDGRTDVWGLGTVLYELLSGQKAFSARERVDAMAQITRQPHLTLSLLDRTLPIGLCAVVDRCLEKSRDRRWSSIADLARALAPHASLRGAALVHGISAICEARLPPQRPMHAGTTGGSSIATLTSEASVNAEFIDPDAELDWGSLQDLAQGRLETEANGVRALSSAGATLRSGDPHWLRRTARAVRRAGLGGPAALAAALALFAAWPPGSASTLTRANRLLGSGCSGPTVYYPASDMSDKTGNARGADWNVFTYGSLSQSHEFARGDHELVVSAAADLAGPELPHLIVRIDGQVVGEVDIDSEAFATYSFPYASPGGAQTITLHFTNDYLREGEDRNLIVRGVAVSQCAR